MGTGLGERQRPAEMPGGKGDRCREEGPLPTPIPDASLQEEVTAVGLLLVTSVRPCEASQNREAAF